MTKPSLTYTYRQGGGTTAEDMWYDEEEITLYEGDPCPECGEGELKVSAKGNLYCSEICWE